MKAERLISDRMIFSIDENGVGGVESRRVDIAVIQAGGKRVGDEAIN